MRTKKIDWVNFLFLTTSPLVAIVGTVALLTFSHVSMATWALALVLMVLTGLAVTAGYHRLFSHRTFEAHPLMRFFFLAFGAAALENSALKWCSDHRDHHQFVDTEKDPYNIKKGFWHAHILWIFFQEPQGRSHNNVLDLKDDRLVLWQNRFYLPLAIFIGFALPTGLASLWGDPLGGFVVGGFLRMVVNHHLTFFINSLCHMWGTQTYSDRNTARDNWVMSLFTYGEGYHNYHHAFPVDYRNGVRAYHWDPAKWLIWGLCRVGLARHLKRVPNSRIALLRLRAEESHMLCRLQARKAALSQDFKDMLANARVHCEQAWLNFEQTREVYKTQYRSFKREKMRSLHDQVDQLKKEYILAKQRVKEARENWQSLCLQAQLAS